MKKLLTVALTMSLIAAAEHLEIAADTTAEGTEAKQPKPLTEPLLQIAEEVPEPELIEQPKPEIKINVDRQAEQRAEAKVREAERVAAEKEQAEQIQKEQAELEQKEKEQAELKQAELKQVEQVATAVETAEPVQPVEQPKPVTSQASTLFAQIVHAEANDEPYVGKVAVAEVILNRVRSNQFPNSVEAVVYQSGQFSPVSNGSINNTPTDEDYRAIAEAENGSNYAQGALYFYNPAIATARDLDAFTTITVIGGHTFK